MEALELSPAGWSGRNVLVTGHTGFKGAWLSQLLHRMGARVAGYSLPPPDAANLFDDAGVTNIVDSIYGDIRNLDALQSLIARTEPAVIFHLAAQALVLPSYADPVETFSVNALGTANVLQAIRGQSSVRAIVVITSDKCYENLEWEWPYREADRLGGSDPYSTSKACAELIATSFKRSFFTERGVAIATARAGNVIGGGDWSQYRIVPDLVRARTGGDALTLRNPDAVRPWQHVLDPLFGYIRLAEALCAGRHEGAWNFGPNPGQERTVRWLSSAFDREWPSAEAIHLQQNRLHEAKMLALDSSKARNVLGWHPTLDVEQAVSWTASWYRDHSRGATADDLCARDISNFLAIQERNA